MCAPAIVNLYKQTKVDLFFNMEETLSYGRQTLANFQKIFSMSTEPITVSPPWFVPLTLWVDGQYTDHAICSQYELLIHFTWISTNYTSTETNDICFRNRHMFSEELVRIFPSTSKNICWEQLSWPRSWIWLVTFVSTVIEHLKRTFFTNQRQQKQFFLQLEICMRKVCVLKK